MTTEDLTWKDIAVHAIQTGNDEIADWIKAEQGRREEARAAAKVAPLVTDAGLMYPGRTYNVTLSYYGKKRTLKGVRLNRTSGYFPNQLVYPSNKHVTIYSDTKFLSITALD